ncbi:unnamed protein product [Anisakis simplex]|uniref:Putative ammonium transporter 2 (inferred by orthology to a C. elegans protein) n=1 Tax=Anisakis simplex TaxID=6269 RepID=A0A0M3J252_ANISI|nr:unnamed protein product [Anisakis simplex]
MLNAEVHLVGGAAGLAATLFLGPRTNRFGEKGSQQMSNPTNAVLGTFMLWWGWFGLDLRGFQAVPDL